jgi:hypothetical protein
MWDRLAAGLWRRSMSHVDRGGLIGRRGRAADSRAGVGCPAKLFRPGELACDALCPLDARVGFGVRTLSPRLAAALCYLVALAIGLVMVATLFPVEFLVPRAGMAWAPQGDAAQHAIAQRYFLGDAWRWPPLVARNLIPPDGLNIAFTDGIPLQALLLKALRGWLPEGFHGIGLWYAIAWVAQPVAAVWCLRAAGETRLLPAIGVALAAVSMPAFINRYGHAALTGQFTIFLALGFYLRLVRAPSVGLWAAAAVAMVATLLIHPYLAAMALAVLAAAPLTLLLRRDPRWAGAAVGTAAAVLAVAGVMVAFGYVGATGDGGFGQFALNLASPFWPYRSWVLGGYALREIDATGHGGWEGYNWLGLGLLLALLAVLATRPRATAAAMRRHAGLGLALAGLTALAVSFRVGAGPIILVDLGPAPGFIEQFRASGRFFWPVGCALLVGTAALLARAPHIGSVSVLAMGLVQFADAAPNRAALAEWVAQRPAWVVDAPALRGLLAQADSVTVLPSWPCVPPRDPFGDHVRQLQVLTLAAERPVPANTMYVARWRGARPACTDAAVLATPLAPGELRIILPGAREQALATMPGVAARCAPLGELLACGPR